MKKFIYSALLIVAANAAAIAQAVLPTAWSFPTTSLPTGWTTAGTAFYTASGFTPPACKFDNTGDILTINFASAPGNLTYYLAGNSFVGGTFLVEESVAGVTWTTLHSFTAPPAGVYTLYTDVPNSASRYIRFNYSNKVSGNIGLDEVNIDAGAASPAQEINIKQGSTTIVTGGTHVLSSPVGVNTSTTFIVENLGTANTLNVSSVNITGAAASDFVVSSSPSSVSATSSANLVIGFTPSASGTRNAIMTINSDDSDEPAYIINLYGIGGSFASAPASQPTALNFSAVKTYRITGTFTAASPAPEGYIVLRKTGSAITDIPADGTVYERGDIIGSSQVVFSGSSLAFAPNSIHANSTYHFAVFSYNGPGVYRNYLTASPLANSVTTPATMQPATYYTTTSTLAPTFVTDLHNKINPHTQQFYSNYGIKFVGPFLSRDTVDNQRVITCVYSGQNQVYTEPFDFTVNGFSREHSYCHNWMPTNPASGLPEYDDYHHLFPTNQDDANAIRSNYPLGEIVGTPSYTYLGCKLGLNAAGQTVFEPRDAQKGDAARALFYMATCYDGVAGNDWSLPDYISTSIPYGQDQSVLKKWHYQDPPDNFEIARNDFVDSLQNNRNPFIDSVQFACYIDFMTMNKITSPSIPCNTVTIGIFENEANSDLMTLSPNPGKGDFMLSYFSNKDQDVTVKLYDVTGRKVFSSEFHVINGNNMIPMSITGLEKGIYLFECFTAKGRKTEKLIIE
ncbi:MAG: endonuclease [Bacteroidota bacterium]|nr:endonuclease [Bacteroidota bacterium]